jgi:hypothetical protein
MSWMAVEPAFHPLCVPTPDIAPPHQAAELLPCDHDDDRNREGRHSTCQQMPSYRAQPANCESLYRFGFGSHSGRLDPIGTRMGSVQNSGVFDISTCDPSRVSSP